MAPVVRGEACFDGGVHNAHSSAGLGWGSRFRRLRGVGERRSVCCRLGHSRKPRTLSRWRAAAAGGSIPTAGVVACQIATATMDLARIGAGLSLALAERQRREPTEQTRAEP